MDAVWSRLGVNESCSDLNGPHERMRDGAAALGWSFKTVGRNADPAAYSPETAGFIGLGDRSGASSTSAAPTCGTPSQRARG